MKTQSHTWFDYLNYIVMTLLACAMVFPVLHVISLSLSSDVAINTRSVFLWPVDATIANYRIILSDMSIWRAFGVSVFVTLAGTFISLTLTSMLAYPLSRPEFAGRKYVLLLILVTMIFHAPLIPNYLLLKNLHLIDKIWVLIIPGAISAYNLFVMRSFFVNLPSELIDCGRMDGAGELRIMWSIVLPLSKPAMATMGLFYGVSLWNAYSNALYYINTRTLYPLQVRLREIVITDQFGSSDQFEVFGDMSPEGVKMAVIAFSALPIMMVYPFLQRFFIKGMLIGSIKS
ncbi:putative aldouronate transport system permease protein [Paenibacillus sp. UNCCL117]|uniref:carbohydrate ABC transporter permease n=1 Tax=unclassified Paenibacillus TaxID=185978 RepID=UPI00088A4A56|nr:MULTISPECIES: carbohydrate ABC transporter permease [unclassified Paenibacillus]SDC05708.1 putative aldouronate transport system permease protein [Paenibacillus sp. cl123]SFW37649.1 putative aldouronate transport system permease protein [Paenibacillus sp. UNCCL117]